MVARFTPRWVFAVAAVVAFSAVAFVGIRAGTDSPRRMVIEGAPAVFGTLSEMLDATDVTIEVRAVSDPHEYVDFGADGKPDFEGQAGLPTELVECIVVGVVRGDGELVGSKIYVSQPSSEVQDGEGSRESDRIDKGAPVVLVASVVKPNPGVGDSSAPIDVPAPWGQGVYDDLGSGMAAARVDGLFGGAFALGVPFHVETLAGTR